VVTYKHDASLLDHSDDSAGAPYSLPVDAKHLSYRLAVSNCVMYLCSYFGLCDLCRSSGTCVGSEIQKVGLVVEMVASHEFIDIFSSEIRGPWDVAVPKVN
jgi:hypothetical protein